MSPSDTTKETPWEATVLKESEEPTDDLIENAIDIVKQYGKASASLLQRRMRIGYPRAARLMDELEAMGVIGPSQSGGKDREVILRTSRDDPAEEDLDQ
jgi:S-DNA-T family DNA segregation ATPase FtsK/SpoIIIE